MLVGAGTWVTFTPIYPNLLLGVPCVVIFCGEVQPAINNETSKRTAIAAIGFSRIMLMQDVSAGLTLSILRRKNAPAAPFSFLRANTF